MEIQISPLTQSSLAYLASIRDQLDMEPLYQRQGEIWSLEKQQLLIDSIINGFDVPKIYWHQFLTPKVVNGKRIRYAIVDGKQRLEAIWSFLDNEFALASDFKFFEDESVELADLTYREFGKRYPSVAARFNATSLSVMLMHTDDVEMIEELFSRLNEAVPLNAAEKRNALGGPLPSAIRDLVERSFFTTRLPFTNNRYRWFDISAKFLLFEEQHGQAVDTKRFHLDNLVKTAKEKEWKPARVKALVASADAVLKTMSETFVDKDRLLEPVGMISVYYLLTRERLAQGDPPVDRQRLLDFDKRRRNNRAIAESDMGAAAYRLLEFDRLAQSPNDSAALQYRLDVLRDFVKVGHVPPQAAVPRPPAVGSVASVKPPSGRKASPAQKTGARKKPARRAVAAKAPVRR